MDNVRIATASRAELEEAACVMAEAFSTEGVHSHLFDFSRRHARTGLRRALRVELESAVNDGDRILVAHAEGSIVGVAMVNGSRRWPAGERMVQGLRWLCAVAPLLPAVRWRNLPAFHRASSLSRPIAGAYYTLPALTVRPAFQGRGIGSMLLREVHELAERDAGILGVYLYTGERRNQLMYEHAGYRTIEMRPAGTLTVYHMFRTHGGHVGAQGCTRVGPGFPPTRPILTDDFASG
jgi:GNAT superfamily N-acetyltransferase